MSLRVLAPQAHHLPLQARRTHQSGQESRDRTYSERDQQQENERRLPGEPVVEADGDRLCVLQRKQQQQKEDDSAHDPASDVHAAIQIERAALSRLTMPPDNGIHQPFLSSLKSTRSRNSFPA